MTEEKYTLITGASSGIGREIAFLLQENNKLLLHGRDINKLKEVHAELKVPSEHAIWGYDFKDINSIEISLQEILLRGVRINKYVHSAGVIQLKPLKITKSIDYHETINVNMISAALIMKCLVSKNNSGELDSAVFISSNLSGHGAKAMSAYGASKGALDSLMTCLAIELAPKVRINSVLPGAILTPMTANIMSNEDFKKKMESTYPLGLGTASEIATTVKFLLSKESGWITGQKIIVDGGRSINLSG